MSLKTIVVPPETSLANRQKIFVVFISVFFLIVIALPFLSISATAGPFTPYNVIKYNESLYQHTGAIDNPDEISGGLGVQLEAADFTDNWEGDWASEVIHYYGGSLWDGTTHNTTPGYLWANGFTDITYSGNSISVETDDYVLDYIKIVVVYCYSSAFRAEGNLSYCINYTEDDGDFDQADPRQGYNWNYSGNFSYRETPIDEYMTDDYVYAYSYDITDLENWNISMIHSTEFAVMFEFSNDGHHFWFDYIGIEWSVIYTGDNLELQYPWPELSDRLIIDSVLWMTFIMGVPVLLNSLIPTNGYIAGMSITLLITVVIEPSFFVVAVFGFASIGILMYKGR